MSTTPASPELRPARGRGIRSPGAWRFLALRYVPVFALSSLAWEIAQLPLYAIFTTGSAREIAFAVIHCTIGDVVIGTAALALALIVTRAGPPASWRFGTLVAVATALGVGYTVFSEWLNVEILRSWAYAELMPLVPPLGTGLAPLLQWIILPGLAFAIALRVHRRRAAPDR